MTVRRVVLLDYGSGNLHSARRALERVGAEVTVTANRALALAADGLVVPGVGAFGACIEGLRGVEGDALIADRLAGGQPVLGICVGMQVLFDRSLEFGSSQGCRIWPGTVDRLPAPVLPHMGWNTVESPARSMLFDGISADERFYFVHSYACQTGFDETQLGPASMTWSHHGADFLAAVENGPLTATQFHPEKSGDAGAHLLQNWVNSLA